MPGLDAELPQDRRDLRAVDDPTIAALMLNSLVRWLLLCGLSVPIACSAPVVVPRTPAAPTVTEAVASRPSVGPSPSTPAAAVGIAPGDYVLTITAASTCSQIPPALRTHSYAATIRNSTAQASTKLVDVSGGSLATPVGFGLDVLGNDVAFTIDGPAFFERLPSFTYVEIAGAAPSGVPVVTTGSGISFAFPGSIVYCVLKSEMGSGDNCVTTPQDQKLAFGQCVSDGHQMTLTSR
jgi:hypothetical protein